ncbi:MAG TPA: hypothetical protein ACFYEJ_09810 [Candidatus Wujingus californicus]|nr:hypothetical protein [Candidatus Brocadiales bacterium]
MKIPKIKYGVPGILTVIVHDGGDYCEGTVGEQLAYERCSWL